MSSRRLHFVPAVSLPSGTRSTLGGIGPTTSPALARSRQQSPLPGKKKLLSLRLARWSIYLSRACSVCPSAVEQHSLVDLLAAVTVVTTQEGGACQGRGTSFSGRRGRKMGTSRPDLGPPSSTFFRRRPRLIYKPGHQPKNKTRRTRQVEWAWLSRRPGCEELGSAPSPQHP